MMIFTLFQVAALAWRRFSTDAKAATAAKIIML
jgi:hypothetical protein